MAALRGKAAPKLRLGQGELQSRYIPEAAEFEKRVEAPAPHTANHKGVVHSRVHSNDSEAETRAAEAVDQTGSNYQ